MKTSSIQVEAGHDSLLSILDELLTRVYPVVTKRTRIDAFGIEYGSVAAHGGFGPFVAIVGVDAAVGFRLFC